MCGSGGSSAQTASTSDNRVVATDQGVAIGAHTLGNNAAYASGNAMLTRNGDITNSGLVGADLEKFLDLLRGYGQGLYDYSVKSLNAVQTAALQQQDPTGQRVENIFSGALENLKWPLIIGASVLIVTALKK